SHHRHASVCEVHPSDYGVAHVTVPLGAQLLASGHPILTRQLAVDVARHDDGETKQRRPHRNRDILLDWVRVIRCFEIDAVQHYAVAACPLWSAATAPAMA